MRPDGAGWPRTFLFVPGDRPDRIYKALGSAADCVIVDLEDAVALSRKEDARRSAVSALSLHGRSARGRIAVRVNGLASRLTDADMAGLAAVWEHLDFLVLPMADGPSVREFGSLIDTVQASVAGTPGGPQIIPLIETAEGVLHAADAAAADPRVATLALGPADLAAQLGISLTAEGEELLLARSQLVLAAAARGLQPPIDGPWLDLEDEAGLRRSAERAVRLGFAAKQVLHPRQIAPVAEIMTPTAEQIAWAQAVDVAFTEAEQRGVASLRLPDGSFVDYPVARRARALLQRSR